MYPLYSLFLQERVGAQRNARGGDPNPEAVDRECDTVASRSASVVGRVEGEKGEPGGRGAGEVPSNNRSSIVPSRYIHAPIPGFRPPRVSSGVICTYQLCLPATKGPSMTSLSLLRRDPMISTTGF